MAPIYKYSLVSVTNILTTTCQYEVRDIISACLWIYKKSVTLLAYHFYWNDHIFFFLQALKYVSFPVQTLAKCAKMIPVMVGQALILFPIMYILFMMTSWFQYTLTLCLLFILYHWSVAYFSPSQSLLLLLMKNNSNCLCCWLVVEEWMFHAIFVCVFVFVSSMVCNYF